MFFPDIVTHVIAFHSTVSIIQFTQASIPSLKHNYSDDDDDDDGDDDDVMVYFQWAETYNVIIDIQLI